MSKAEPVRFECPACGHSCPIWLPESVNAATDPQAREALLAGTLMRYPCEACGESCVIERELLYTDLDRGTFILVFPRAREKEASALADVAREVFRQAVTGAPRIIAEAYAHIEPRVVFGYDQLREKVVCTEAGLDDRVIEAVKHMLLQVPGAAQSGVSGLLLTQVGEQGELYFAQIGTAFTPDQRPLLGVERAIYDDMTSGRMSDLLKRDDMLGGPYVSQRRLLPEGLP